MFYLVNFILTPFLILNSCLSILAEDTRVHLQEGRTTYINANYIPGMTPNSEKMYIVTQGPLEETFQDFWRF